MMLLYQNIINKLNTQTILNYANLIVSANNSLKFEIIYYIFGENIITCYFNYIVVIIIICIFIFSDFC